MLSQQSSKKRGSREAGRRARESRSAAPRRAPAPRKGAREDHVCLMDIKGVPQHLTRNRSGDQCLSGAALSRSLSASHTISKTGPAQGLTEKIYRRQHKYRRDRPFSPQIMSNGLPGSDLFRSSAPVSPGADGAPPFGGRRGRIRAGSPSADSQGQGAANLDGAPHAGAFSSLAGGEDNRKPTRTGRPGAPEAEPQPEHGETIVIEGADYTI